MPRGHRRSRVRQRVPGSTGSGDEDEVVGGEVLAEKTERIVLFRKTKMCKFHILGVCAKGDGCKFAHQKEDLCPLPDLSRTKLCKTLISTGGCNDPACTYAHNKEELRLLPVPSDDEPSPPISARDALPAPKSAMPLGMGAGGGAPPAVNAAMQTNLPPQLWQYIASLPAEQAMQLMSNATAQVTTMPWVQVQTGAPVCAGQTQMAAAIPVMVQQPMMRQPMQPSPGMVVAQAPRVQQVPALPAPAPAPAPAVAKRGWLHDALVGDAHPAFSEPQQHVVADEQPQPTYFAGHPADVAGGVPHGTRSPDGADANKPWHRVVVKNTFLEVNTGGTPVGGKLRPINTWAGDFSSIEDEGDGDFGAGFGGANGPWISNECGVMRTTDSAVSMVSLQDEEERRMAEAAAKKAMTQGQVYSKTAFPRSVAGVNDAQVF